MLYVDDMLIAAKSKKEITTLKAQLSSEFEMKDLGAPTKILGMEITRDRKYGLLFLSQHDHINKVLHCFNMPNAKKSHNTYCTTFQTVIYSMSCY
jgi:ATP-binding cassette subfamily B (MDR/TAP) protein 1